MFKEGRRLQISVCAKSGTIVFAHKAAIAWTSHTSEQYMDWMKKYL
jgi:hypothetical protein